MHVGTINPFTEVAKACTLLYDARLKQILADCKRKTP
jgi:hypothetical protein